MFAARAISHRVRAANHAVFLRAYKNQSAVSHVPVSYEIVPEFSVIYSLMNFDEVFTLNCNVSFWKNVVCDSVLHGAYWTKYKNRKCKNWNRKLWPGTLAQPGEYDWTACLLRQCGLSKLTTCLNHNAQMFSLLFGHYGPGMDEWGVAGCCTFWLVLKISTFS